MTISNPFQQSLSFLGLEVVVLVCCGLTLAHALGRWRAGDRQALFAWATLLFYGVYMELITYGAFDNFSHARFTVMFYHGKLPLYVVALYPFFLYTALQTVSRLGLSRAAEPLAVGLAVWLLDVPFDINGPDAGWWFWSPTDENLRARWLGVPVTSYYWHIAFGASLALLIRAARPLAGVKKALAVALLPVLAIALGMVAFIPFHVLKRFGVPDGALVAALIAGAALVLLTARRSPASPSAMLRAEPLLFLAAALHYAFHLTLLGTFAVGRLGPMPQLWAKASVIVTIAATALVGSARVCAGGAVRSDP